MTTCEYGHSNADGARFCSTCGMAVGAYTLPATGDLQQPPAPPAPPPAQASWHQRLPTSRAALLQSLRDPRGALVAASVFLLLAGLLASVTVSDKKTIEGTFSLYDADDVEGDLEDCQGTGGYSDIDDGVPVTVRNENDKLVGSGTLRHGSKAEIARRIADSEDADSLEDAKDLVDRVDGLFCILVFDAEVEDAEFYDVQVGRRGKISFSRSELEENGWTASFSIGGST